VAVLGVQVLNVESDTPGGCAVLIERVATWLKTQPDLQVDASKLQA
jgi:hypothetical protein